MLTYNGFHVDCYLFVFTLIYMITIRLSIELSSASSFMPKSPDYLSHFIVGLEKDRWLIQSFLSCRSHLSSILAIILQMKDELCFGNHSWTGVVGTGSLLLTSRIFLSSPLLALGQVVTDLVRQYLVTDIVGAGERFLPRQQSS